jgi:hypothetical protein
VHTILNVVEFRLKVHQELSNKTPRALEYQSSVKVEEGLMWDAQRITETIRYCDKDEV